MVRAANTGISAVIDPRGEIRHSVPLGRAGAFTEVIPAASEPTLYARFGEVGIFVLLIVLLLIGILGARKRRVNQG